MLRGTTEYEMYNKKNHSRESVLIDLNLAVVACVFETTFGQHLYRGTFQLLAIFTCDRLLSALSGIPLIAGPLYNVFGG